MSWFSDLAGKAENLLNNLDEQTGAALGNHNAAKQKKAIDKHDVLHVDSYFPKKRPPRKKAISETKSNNIPPLKPTIYPRTRSQTKEIPEMRDRSPGLKKFSKRSTHYNLNNCPNTLVENFRDNDVAKDQFGLKHRRFSLPADLEIISNEHFTYKMQNLEVENAMLKNELNVMNREVSQLLDRLRKTEDELTNTQTKLEKSNAEVNKLTLEKNSLTILLNQLKQEIKVTSTTNIINHEEHNKNLEKQADQLRLDISDLEIRLQELNEKSAEKDRVRIKLETELRHSQSIANKLQSDLEKSNAECLRLENDWESYKIRVKSMLYAKDNEIKALQDGINLTEDTKIYVGQIENLKEEREELSEAIAKVRTESDGMKLNIKQLESKYSSAEHLVTALRDALREERSAKNRAEAQCSNMGKELRSLEIETGQTIASLRTALRDKESEINQLRATASSIRTSDTSALNVADYDVTIDTIDADKIEYLTSTLVQRQGKIDTLLAENNTLKIQLEKIETKHRLERSATRINSHSVVQLQDSGRRSQHQSDSIPSMSSRVGGLTKRYPLLRTFIFFYMICLHFWVLTVLFNSTPEDYFKRPPKS